MIIIGSSLWVVGATKITVLKLGVESVNVCTLPFRGVFPFAKGMMILKPAWPGFTTVKLCPKCKVAEVAREF